MRGRRGGHQFSGGNRGHNRGRAGSNQHSNTRGGRRFSAEGGPQNYRPNFQNGQDPGFENVRMEGAGMIQEHMYEKEPPTTVGQIEEGVLTEEDGEILDDPPMDALLPSPDTRVVPVDGFLLPSPGTGRAPTDALLPSPGSKPIDALLPLPGARPALLPAPISGPALRPTGPPPGPALRSTGPPPGSALRPTGPPGPALRPPGPPPGPPPEGAQPYVPIGLTHQGQKMFEKSTLHRGEHLLPPDDTALPPQHIGPPQIEELKRDEHLSDLPFNSRPSPLRHPEVVRDQKIRRLEPQTGVKAKDANGIPVFLLCPLCNDLLLKPRVLPCFHAICGERCIPKLIEDGRSVWCPTCQCLKFTKHGIASLKSAETFGKMSGQIRDERRVKAIENGELDENCTIEEYEETEVHQGTIVDDLTCPECHKIFSLPLKLPCSHSICKFPCAYKILKFNVKIICMICDKPNYCNDGVKALPVDEALVERIKTIKGDYFVEEFEQKLRDIAERADVQHRVPEGEQISEEDLNKYRFQKVKSAEQRDRSIPSLLSMDVELPPPPVMAAPPPFPGQDSEHGPPMHLEDQVTEELRRIRNDQDSQKQDFQDFEQHMAGLQPQNHPTGNVPPFKVYEGKPKTKEEHDAEDDYIAEELPPELAAMANAWAGPKRCRPKQNDAPPKKYNNKRFGADAKIRADRFKKYEKSREVNKFIDDSVPPGVEIFEYDNRRHPIPPRAPSLLDLDVKPPKRPLRPVRKDLEHLPPLDRHYQDLEDDVLLGRPFPLRRPPFPEYLDDFDPYMDPILDEHLPPLRIPPPRDLPPLGPDGLPLKNLPGLPPHHMPGMGPEGTMVPPPPHTGPPPLGPPSLGPPPLGPPPLGPPPSGAPPPGASPAGAPGRDPPLTGIQPSVPGLNVVLNPVKTSIPSMIYGTGSGPPPIVNYVPPSTTAVVSSAAAVMPGPTLPQPGQLQAAPATLPVMDPSTIPTMSSAFEYQAHWTKFVQQTQAYYNNLYAAQGGTPAEAQQTINDYLAKCWAWYSAYTNLCLVNPEYKDMGKELKKEKPMKQPDVSGTETEEQSHSNPNKKEGKNKKKKNKNKGKTKPTEGANNKDEGIEEKDLEELKIMLLKKQLELKVKHARNKSELRGLMNMKKLILEEEGEEKVEEIDEEEREKVKEAAKLKQLEREQEIERQEQDRAKDREKEIQRLEQERIREREKERQKEKEKMRRKEQWESRKEKLHEREYQQDKYMRGRHGEDHYKKKKRKRYNSSPRSRSRSRSYSRSRSRSYSRSRSRSPIHDYRGRPGKQIHKEESKDEEPKYIKVANLPDELKAVELKSFVEAFGRVLNCKIGKMQGEMMAVVQMASLADAMSCVRDMHGSQFKSKLLEVKYMGNKPNLKSVEVSIPDVHSGPSSSGVQSKNKQYKSMAGPSYGYGGGPDYYNRPPEIRHIWIGNLPWGSTEEEVMGLVHHHGTPLDCRIATNSDPSQRGLYAIVTMETYIDVLKCINSLHGLRFEGRTLDVKKMKY